VMAYRKDRKLKLSSLDDPQLKTLKIGVQVNTPPHEALAQRGIADNVEGYQLMFDSNYHAEDYPGKLIEDLLAGSVDVALVWGPIAGYFVTKRGAALEIVALEDAPDSPTRFAFEISMGVRKGNTALKDKLEEALARRHDDVEHILQSFGVPLLPIADSRDARRQR
jgi:mxaJ protein